jgi:hypothetical protein
MRTRLVLLCVVLLVASTGLAQSKLEVLNHDGRISIVAEQIELGRLLRLWDQATGMSSVIPRELGTREVRLQFTDLDIDQAVQKIFENQQLDYVFVNGEGIRVIGETEAPDAEPETVQEEAFPEEALPEDDEFPGPEVRRTKPVEPRLPPLVPTPFGPIVDPGRNTVIHHPPIPGEIPAPAFFAPPLMTPFVTPPPVRTQDDLFRPIPIYQNPFLPLMPLP